GSTRRRKWSEDHEAGSDRRHAGTRERVATASRPGASARTRSANRFDAAGKRSKEAWRFLVANHQRRGDQQGPGADRGRGTGFLRKEQVEYPGRIQGPEGKHTWISPLPAAAGIGPEARRAIAL